MLTQYDFADIKKNITKEPFNESKSGLSKLVRWKYNILCKIYHAVRIKEEEAPYKVIFM